MRFTVLPSVAAACIIMGAVLIGSAGSDDRKLREIPRETFDLNLSDRSLLAQFDRAFGPRGRQLSFEDAKAAFQTSRRQYEMVVNLLDACVPRRKTGFYNRLWVDPLDAQDYPPLHCSRGNSNAPLEEITSLLKDLEVLSIDYGLGAEGVQPGSVRSVEFSIFTQGMAVSGSATSIVYNAGALSCSPLEEGGADAGYLLRRRALTGGPCKWFWQQQSS